MGHGKRHKSSDSDSESSSSSDSYVKKKARRIRKHGRKRVSSGSDSDLSSDDEHSLHRKTRRKRKHRSDSRKKEKRRESSKIRRKKNHDGSDTEDAAAMKEESAKAKSKLQVTMEAREQEKFLIYQNAEIAKARLSGELKQAQAEQAKMQDMYGAIDWRARKKLRLEKKKLERSVAAGKRLAQMEEEESARMDAFRVALGLPTAEAQRQAEWRAEATRAMVPMDAVKALKKPSKKAIIGPQLPKL